MIALLGNILLFQEIITYFKITLKNYTK